MSSMNISSWESLPEASAKAPQSPSAMKPLRSFERFTRASEPVSYTHLDVYKRQALGPTPVPVEAPPAQQLDEVTNG